MKKSTLDKIESIVGGNNFLDSIEDKLVYSYDGTPLISHKPEAIVLPTSVDISLLSIFIVIIISPSILLCSLYIYYFFN